MNAMAAAAGQLGAGFARSLLLHGVLTAGILAWQWYGQRPRERWGDPNAMAGGSVTIQAVARIPVPERPGPVNPVANDTASELPAPPKQATPQPPPPDPREAVALQLKRERRTAAEVAASRQRYRPERPEPENQIYASTGQRAVSPLFGVEGSGGVGTGIGSPFGSRFGWYEALLRQRVAQRWRTQEVDPRIRTAPPVIVTFTILRDGSARNIRVAQSSGNYQIDLTALRAVNEAAPFPPLPPQFERDSAAIEFWFELKR